MHHRTYARQFHPRARRRLELGYRIERTLASVHTPCEGSGWTAVHVALRRARSLERLVLVLGCLLGCLEERRLDHRGALAEWRGDRVRAETSSDRDIVAAAHRGARDEDHIRRGRNRVGGGEWSV